MIECLAIASAKLTKFMYVSIKLLVHEKYFFSEFSKKDAWLIIF